MTMTTTTTTTKKIVVFSLCTLSFAAAAAAAILDIFSQSSFWKKKRIQLLLLLKEEEKLNPEGGGGSTSAISTPPPGGPPPDRISELPVEILHRILGFLKMDELLIGTSLVSTKWRNLWKSVSTLKFTHSVGSDSSEKYQNFVDNVLRLRDSEASKIQIFRYIWYDYSNLRGGVNYYYQQNENYLERLHNFIVSAVVNQGAQEIRIIGSHLGESIDNNNNNNNRIIHFNPSIFTSLIRKFSFAVFTTEFLIQFPRSMCCCSTTQLTHLSLSGIILPEGDDSNAAQLHLVCPVLETLVIRCCDSKHLKVLDISAPRLNYLSICNTGMRDGYLDDLGGCRLEIRTPNLTSLLYSGCVYVDCFTENLPHLFYANLNFITEERNIFTVVEQTTSFAIKLLKGLTSAKTLSLAGFEFFSQDTLKDLLTSFTSLTTLELVTNCNISSIHGMVHFLNSCSSVQKLLLVLEVDRFVEVEGDEHLMLPQCRLTHLKHVQIKRLHGHENEIEFVKFLLKSSVVLEEVIIQTTADSPKQSIEEKLKQFIEEEPSFRSIKLCVLQGGT